MEKKKCPTLYPINRSLEKYWFIKYQVPCFITGKYIYKKHSGQLNLLPTVAEREQEAKLIIERIEKGLPLDLCQGYRRFKKESTYNSFASISKLTIQVLVDRLSRGEVEGSTFTTYKSRLQVFLNWLELTDNLQLPFGAFTITHTKEFLKWAKTTKGFGNGYINSVKTLMYGIWKEIISEKEVKGISNAWSDINSLPHKSQPFLSLTVDLEVRIADTMPVFDIQLWILTQFIYYDFIRIAELMKMQIHHIDFHRHEITVPEYIARKSKKTRRLVIPKQLMYLLIEQGYNNANPDMYIFSKNGKPGYDRLGKNYFNRLYSRYRKEYNIPTAYKLYGFKHTGNSKLASIGVNAQMQKQHNGHASLEYTQRYNSNLSHADLEFLKERFPTFAQVGKSLYYDDSKGLELTEKQLLDLAHKIQKIQQDVI